MSSLVDGNQVEDSNTLLNRLLECVQDCQKRYGGKTELATEFDQCVSSLCKTLETVFLHGLRHKPLENVSTLKQVSVIVTNSLHLSNDNPSFWPFIKKHLTKHETDRYNVLKHIWTDSGRCKAWIRSTLNERSLERYCNTLINNKQLLRVYYEDWAFLYDDEKSSLLPNMAAGLGSILFAVSIDKPELNSCLFNRQVKQIQEPIIEAPIIEPNSASKELKKKRKVAKQIISFDDDSDSLLSTSIPSSTGSIISETLSQNQSKFEHCKVKEMMEEETSSTTSSGSSETSKKVERKLSIETSGARERYPTKLEGTLTPLEPDVGELTPVSVEQPGDSVGLEAVEVPSDVSAVLTAVETKNNEELMKLNEKIHLLAKENDNLKAQVKKYMGAVQMLKCDDANLQKAFNGLQVNVPDYKSEAKQYEQKLVQVAEMHAELMDFNVVLQQALCQKDILIEKLKSELEELKGPITNDELLDESRCVNVWIPSAFLTGTGSEAHHVYQLYLRAGSDEWNIYRRYAQFHALHSDLKKLDSVVASFDFPPKKSLRNKDSSLVEDRRKRLQTYLRRILSHWPELSQCQNRFLLEQHLAFFKEQKEAKNDKKGLFASRGTTNHYTGL